MSRRGNFPVFLYRDVQGSVVHLGVRAGISIRVASNRIILTIELARPLDVDRFTVCTDAVLSRFHLAKHALEGHGVELTCARRELRFRFVQLPSAHLRVGSETRGGRQKGKRESQSNRSYFHGRHRNRTATSRQYFSELTGAQKSAAVCYRPRLCFGSR